MPTNTTGTNPVQTGATRTQFTGLRPPQQKQPITTKLLQWWGGMTTKQKWMIAGGLVAVVLLFFIAGQIKQATAYVPLYENALSADDLQSVTTALAEMGIPYQKTQDNHILVPPAKRVEALVQLTKQGIPKHPFEQMPQSSAMGETHEQFTAEQKLMLERDLTLVLRQFNEISDANVNLVIPSEASQFFSNNTEQAKAAVVVKLNPDYETLSLPEAQSIINLVSYSVPDLKPNNVELTDTAGHNYSLMLKQSSDMTVPTNMIDIKKKYEQAYEDKIRQILDPVLGPGKYALAVNVDLNWNQSESQSQTVGNPELNTSGTVPVELQKTTEKFNKKDGSQSGPQQLGFNLTTGENGNPKYEKTELLQKNDYDRTVTTTKVTPGQPTRITASVLADEAISPSAQRTLAAEIKNAIGMNPTRGDSVVFGTLPFHQDVIKQMGEQLNQPSFFRENAPSNVSSSVILKALALTIFLFIGFIAYALYKQQKAKSEKAQLVLAAGPTATVSEISDLLQDKTGKMNPVQQQGGKANQTEKLEILAKEKPTKVAELLKTTWLAEK
jgi:flagellar M-ring protein FliF